MGSVNFDIRQVIAGGLCVGCGACSVVSPAISMRRGKFGAMVADISSDDDSIRRASAVCPFSDESVNEDGIADRLYGQMNLRRVAKVGYVGGVFAGRVVDVEYVYGSSSGGLTSWLCIELLKLGVVDGVVHVGFASGNDISDELFAFQVSHSVPELVASRKSQYYSTSFEGALRELRGNGRRYAFVGVPCYIKALRNLCRVDTVLEKQIVLAIGLVCGHMKTPAFAMSMAWQIGIEPENLESVDFRFKDPSKNASKYLFSARGRDGRVRSAEAASLVGGNWGHASFQMEACDFCDDVFAETADVVFGDAWLPKYESDPRGTNVVVVRHPVVEKILTDGFAAGALVLDDLQIDELLQSQSGNFRHRWEGLSVRLEDDALAGVQRPRKRIRPGSIEVDERRRAIVRLRRVMAARSHEYFEGARRAQDLNIYLRGMRPLARQMRKIVDGSIFHRIFRRVRKVIGL